METERWRRVRLVGTLASWVCASTAAGQVDSCDVLAPGGCSEGFGDGASVYLAGAVPQPQGVVKDPRPVVRIPCWNGDTTDPLGIGRAPWWRDETLVWVDDPSNPGEQIRVMKGVVTLRERMGALYDRGFRRMVLMLPAGSHDDSIMSAAQYWNMRGIVRSSLADLITPWLAQLDAAGDPITWGVYAGYKLSRDHCDVLSTPQCLPDVTNPTHTRRLVENLVPWADLGLDEYWFDGGAVAPETLVLIQQMPEIAGRLRIGGEAIPILKPLLPGCRANANQVELLRTPYTSRLRFSNLRFANPSDAWKPDAWPNATPENTELGIMFASYTDACTGERYDWTLADVERYAAAGWVLWSTSDSLLSPNSGPTAPTYWYAQTLEMIQRVNDLGRIESLADFNADGYIDSGDLSEFAARFAANVGKPGLSYRDADLTGDATVDGGDLSVFITAYLAFATSGAHTPLDMGRLGPGH
jgi:hypothetical protein